MEMYLLSAALARIKVFSTCLVLKVAVLLFTGNKCGFEPGH